jgi:D-cysteine desulfhydrase
MDIKEKSDIKKILGSARLHLGKWPTPLTYCSALGQLMIKRDDLSGFGRGGIKTRKLEYFLGYFLEKGIRCLVMVVPNLSNLRSDIEKLAADAGLHIEFIVADDPPMKDRQFRDQPHIKYTPAGKSMAQIAWVLLGKYFRAVLTRKDKVALVLPGASHPSSVIGASAGLLELYDQCREMNSPMPRHIFISASGGASAAGLILSGLLLQQQGAEKTMIHVVRVFPIPLKAWILFLLHWTKRKYKLKVRIRSEGFRIWKSPMAYGECNEALEKCCREVKESYGLKVDHIYGARTWTTMEKFVQTEYDGGGLLFWHCGFTPDAGIFRQ